MGGEAAQKAAALNLLQALARTLTGDFRLPVGWAAGESYTDGQRIWVDSELEYARKLNLGPGARLRCQRGHTAHEAFHVLWTDFPEWMRFGEAAREGKFGFPAGLVRAVGNIAEDSRIELWGANQFPGALEWIRLKNLSAARAAKVAEDPVTGFVQGLLCWMKIGAFPPGYEERHPRWVAWLWKNAAFLEQVRRSRSTRECLGYVPEILRRAEAAGLPRMDPGELPKSLLEHPPIGGGTGQVLHGEPGPLDPRIRPSARTGDGRRKPDGDKGAEPEGEKAPASGHPAGSWEKFPEESPGASANPGTGSDKEREGEMTGGAGDDTGDTGDAASDSPDEEPGMTAAAGEESDEEWTPDAEGSENAELGPDEGTDGGSAGIETGDGGGGAPDGPEAGDDEWEPASGEPGAEDASGGGFDEGDEPEEDGALGAGRRPGAGDRSGDELAAAEEEGSEEWFARLLAAAEAEELASLRLAAEPEEEPPHDPAGVKALAEEVAREVRVHHGVGFEEVEAWSSAHEEMLYTRMRQELQRVSTELYLRLKPLVARSRDDALRGERSGSLDVGRVWRLKALGDTHVFQRRRLPYEPAWSVYLLVDSSGSMSQYTTGSLTRADLVKVALVVITDVLDRLGVTHTVTTFKSAGGGPSESVFHRRVLRWGQRSGRGSVLCWASGGNNRDGFSIRVAAKELLKRPEPVKLLFVFSDGQPEALGYHSSHVNDTGVVDTAAAVSEALRAGLEVIGFYFGDMRKWEMQLERLMFGSRVIPVRDLQALPTEVARMLRRIVGRHRAG